MFNNLKNKDMELIFEGKAAYGSLNNEELADQLKFLQVITNKNNGIWIEFFFEGNHDGIASVGVQYQGNSIGLRSMVIVYDDGRREETTEDWKTSFVKFITDIYNNTDWDSDFVIHYVY